MDITSTGVEKDIISDYITEFHELTNRIIATQALTADQRIWVLCSYLAIVKQILVTTLGNEYEKVEKIINDMLNKVEQEILNSKIC